MTPALTAFRRLNDVFVLALLCLLQFAFVFGLPWMDNGLWPQVEGPAAAIHFLCAGLCLFAGFQLAIKDEKYLKSISSPVVATLFAFALVAAALSVFADSAIRSIQGNMKHGVGVIWQLEMALAAFAALALWQDPCLRRIAVWSSVLACAAVLGLQAFPANPVGTPLSFPEWTGILALMVAGAFVLSRDGVKGASGRALTWAVAIVLLAAGTAISQNRAVALALLGMGFYLAAARMPGLRILRHDPRLRAVSVVFLAVLAGVAVYAAGPLIERHAIAHAGSFPTVLSEAPVDRAAVQDTALGTVWSRSYMVRIVVSDLIDHPIRLLEGNGFGHFATAYEHHSREVAGRRFPEAVPTASTTFWDVHSAANFHSHNMLVETLASVGVFGTIVWLWVFVAMSRGSVAGAATSIGMILVGSFWFPVNHFVGPLAILYAAVSPVGAVSVRASRVLPSAGSLVAVLGTCLLGYLGTAATVLGVVERAERGFVPVKIEEDVNKCGFIRTRFFPEDEIVIDLNTILVNRVMTAKNRQLELWNHSTNVVSINCMLRRYYQRDGNIRALVSSLDSRNPLANFGNVSYGALKQDLIHWGDDLELLLKIAPERTELLPPYVTILAQRLPTKADSEIARFLPMLKEGDPVRWYLLAVKSRDEGDMEGYKEKLRKAVRLGYANLWTVTPETAKFIGAR